MVDALCRFVEVAAEPMAAMPIARVAWTLARRRARRLTHAARTRAQSSTSASEHVLVGAVGDADVARPEDDARRAADVDEQPHVGAVRLAEHDRAAAGDRFDGLGERDRQRMVGRRPGPSRTGRR